MESSTTLEGVESHSILPFLTNAGAVGLKRGSADPVERIPWIFGGIQRGVLIDEMLFSQVMVSRTPAGDRMIILVC